MQAPERIETARLTLRRPQRTDADAIFRRFANDPEVTRHAGWPIHRSLGIERMQALCHPDHRASQRVLP